MLWHKTKSTSVIDSFDNMNDSYVASMLHQLRSGLQMVLNALQNYSIAFEALGGMKGVFSQGALTSAPIPAGPEVSDLHQH